ncbi:MAG: uracil-DNA glycosylase [Nitrospirota bacterium]
MDKSKELLKIAREIEACSLCKEWGSGKAVPGEGNPDAKIMFIGEAPGVEESKTGRPFVGRSGSLLRTMIRDIGLREENVYITNTVKYLPKKGTPSKGNIAHSRTHFLNQLDIINPRLLVLLGSIACFAVLGRTVPITKEHGTVIDQEGRLHFITFHPAAALRFPETKKEFIRDFQKLRTLLIKNKLLTPSSKVAQ